MTTYIYVKNGQVRTTNRKTRKLEKAKEYIAVSKNLERIRLVKKDKGQEYVFDYEKAFQYTGWDFKTWFSDTIARITALVSEVKLVDKLVEMYRSE